MNHKISFEVFYPHRPARVWAALTETNLLAEWLMPTDFQPEVGKRFAMSESGKKIEGEVLECEPERLLRYTWEDGESGTPSVVTWQLFPTDGGTKLRLDHAVASQELPMVLLEAQPNWNSLLRYSLNALLVGVPIVYAPDEPEKGTDRRAGFRQPEEVKA